MAIRMNATHSRARLLEGKTPGTTQVSSEWASKAGAIWRQLSVQECARSANNAHASARTIAGGRKRKSSTSHQLPSDFVRRSMCSQISRRIWLPQNCDFWIIFRCVESESPPSMSVRRVRTQLYAPQTKILEIRTNLSDRVFKALFAYVSTSFGRLTIEKCFENMVRNVCSDFQNLRLGGVNLGAWNLSR
jgi:hypothetical protein